MPQAMPTVFQKASVAFRSGAAAIWSCAFLGLLEADFDDKNRGPTSFAEVTDFPPAACVNRKLLSK
jgi:hypothetical protein